MYYNLVYMNRYLSIIVGILIVLGIGATVTPKKAALCKGCNILLIVLDPLRADAVGVHTPTLTALAKRGYVFTNAMAVAPWTLPSAMSLMTGTYPSTHNIINKDLIGNQSLIPASLASASPSLRTLATELKESGYVTGAFVGGAALASSYGFDQGFDVYESDGNFMGLSERLPNALAFIRDHQKEKTFVTLHGFDVHGQYIPPGGLDRRFVSASYTGKLNGSKEEQKTLREEGVTQGRVLLASQDVAFLRAIYDEKVERADSVIATLLKEYESLGLLDSTIIVISSHHGDEFYEHGRIDHGMTLYDEVLHIPLLIIIPGNKKDMRISDQVRNIDIPSTLFSLINYIPSSAFAAQTQGVSLLPLMEGKRLSLDIYPETEYRYATKQRGVRSWDGWKLISDEESSSRQLFNLREDPKETNNIYGRGFDKESELVSKLLLTGE